MTHGCTRCGRFAFPAPTVCYWCAHPLSPERRGALVLDGILAVRQRYQSPLAAYRAARDAARHARQ